MITVAINNQKRGVGKTTTALNLARELADRGLRTLLVDADSQGSIAQLVGLNPERSLYDFLHEKQQLPLSDCVVKASDRLDVLCSDRRTKEAEDILMARMGREMTFDTLFRQFDQDYDAVLIDTAPSLSLFQTCSMIYTRAVLVPVAMDPQSLQGVVAIVHGAETITSMFRLQPEIRVIGILPTIVAKRQQMSDIVTRQLKLISSRHGIPLLPGADPETPGIRTDVNVTKAARERKFLADYEPKSRALEDYRVATTALLDHLGVKIHAATEATAG